MKHLLPIIIIPLMLWIGCGINSPVVHVMTVSDKEGLTGFDETELARLAEIKNQEAKTKKEAGLETVIEKTPNYTVREYLTRYPESANPVDHNYTVGGYDVISILVYEEPDLTRRDVNISADGYISFPLIGQLKVAGLATSEIETLISNKLAQGQFILNAHVSVNVEKYKSKQYMVLGVANQPGAFSLHAHERVIDAFSQAGGINFKQAGKIGMIIRTLNPNVDKEKKIVIRFDIQQLLKEGDQLSNLILEDKDLVYIPKAEYFYIIGEIQQPGSYPYLEDKITLVEAISNAGGFTKIAARNNTRIVRVEAGIEKIIEIKVDEITQKGKKGKDIQIQPGDIIVVPESFF